MKLIPMGRPALRAIEDYGNRTPPVLRGREIALDSETTGLDPYHGARVFCYSYSTERGEHGHLPKTPKTTAWIFDKLADRRNRLSFQNAKYDLKMFTFEGFDLDDLRAEWHDTLASAMIVEEYGSHDLGSLVQRWLGQAADVKESVDVWLAKNVRRLREELGRDPNYSDIPTKVIVPYSIWDVDHTLKLRYFFKKPMETVFKRLYENERELIHCTIEMENRGLLVDFRRVRELKEKALEALEFLVEKMTDVVGRDFIIKGTGSKKEILKVITEDLEWEIKRRTAKGNPQFDEFALLGYVHNDLHHIIRDKKETLEPRDYIAEFEKQLAKTTKDRRQIFVPALLKWRELDKMVSTYYRPFRRMAIPWKKNPKRYGVIHGRFNSLKAITGRFSSSEPNLQNIPRILGPRQCFVARPGYVNYHFDYSQVEMRLFIHYARDQKLKDALLAGKDLHLQTAVEIFEKPEKDVTPEERKKAKSTNFGILYGSGAEKLAETLTKMGIPTTKAEAMKYLARYHRSKPSVRKIMSKITSELMRKGFVENEYGRRFRVPKKLAYKALNALIQGCAADIMKFAMVRIWRYLKSVKAKTRLVLTVHDEIVPEVHRSEEKWIVPKIKELMEADSGKFWVPITCDVERTERYWSEKSAKSRTCIRGSHDDCGGRWSFGHFECECKCHSEKESKKAVAGGKKAS